MDTSSVNARPLVDPGLGRVESDLAAYQLEVYYGPSDSPFAVLGRFYVTPETATFAWNAAFDFTSIQSEAFETLPGKIWGSRASVVLSSTEQNYTVVAYVLL